MPTDPQDLAARVAAATKDDTARGLTFTAVFDALEHHLGAGAAIACDPQGTGRRTEFFSYPIADFLRLAYGAADRLEAKLGSVDAAFHEMGYRTTSNVFSSTLGATLLALTGKAGLRAMLGQTPNAYRTMVSYGDRRLDWIGERHLRLTFVRDFVPTAYHLGVLQAAIDARGARAERLEARVTGPLDAVYDVAWSDPR